MPPTDQEYADLCEEVKITRAQLKCAIDTITVLADAITKTQEQLMRSNNAMLMLQRQVYEHIEEKLND